MNGRYLVASGGHQAVPFNDDYASKGHEYFDVYSPEIATHYGEVFWTDQGNNPIPQAIISRFAGKLTDLTRTGRKSHHFHLHKNLHVYIFLI